MKGRTLFKWAMVQMLLSIAILTAGPSIAAQKMLIGSTSASSSHYGYFVAVSQVINDKAGLETSVVETGATVDNLRRIARNQVDLGLVTTNVMAQAYYGKQSFAGKPVKAKLLWVYVIAPQNVIVRKDSNIKTISDLTGRKFNPGMKGSATEKTSEAVFKTIGIKPDYYRGSTTNIVTAIKDNNITGYVKSGAGMKLDASTRDISTFTPISILTLTDSQISSIQKELPEISIVKVPGGPGIGAYTTWGFAVACAAGLNLDEESAYRIVKAICEDTSVQGSAMSSVKNADFVEMTLKYATSPLHPGAIRYFKEKGKSVPNRLID